MVKMESRYPIEKPVGRVLSSIYIVRELKWLEVASRWRFRRKIWVIWKRPFTGKVSKFCSERIHCNTDPRLVYEFREIWPADRKSVESCIIYLTKKNKFCLALASARIAPKSCQGQQQTMFSECSRFHPTRFTFGRVISERANAIRARSKVNPTFGWSLASSRITISEMQLWDAD